MSVTTGARLGTGNRWAELVVGPFRAAWRSGFAWAVAFVLLIVATVAFWPAFKGSTALEDALKVLPAPMLEAFGLVDFASPAGYLRAGLYEVLIPLMFAALGILMVSGATAAEEDSGRLELVLAQPVTRRSVLVGRALALLLWLIVLTAVVIASQVLSDVAFDLQIDSALLLSTIVLCALLGAAHAGLAFAIAGITGRPGLVQGIGLVVALAGYLVMALFPLSEALKPWAVISPWEWALGGDPLVNAAEAWRYVALAVPPVVLTLIGIIAFDRRDVRSA
jgi:ABC-2 type transport system permease protein